MYMENVWDKCTDSNCEDSNDNIGNILALYLRFCETLAYSPIAALVCIPFIHCSWAMSSTITAIFLLRQKCFKDFENKVLRNLIYETWF